MARLPTPGSDDGTWGNVLNDFLAAEHNADGSLKLRTDGTLAAKADTTDARFTDQRTPTDGSVTNVKVAANAAIDLSKLATDPLDRTNHTGTQSADTLVDGTNNKAFTAAERTQLAALAASPGGTSAATKLLIKHGQDIPSAAQFAANKALYDSRPFDGWVVYLPTYDGGTISSTAYSQANYDAAIAAFPTNMTKATHNWIRLIFVNDLDFTDDTQWTTIATNMQRLATAIANSGKQIDGIFMDTEWYGTGAGPWDYGTGGTPWSGDPMSAGAVSARDQARARGKQVMDAVTAGWPAARLLTTYGPWVGETLTFDVLGEVYYNDVAWANELMGAFCYGIAQSTFTTGATYIDGGEVYGPREPGAFALLRGWQKRGFADSGSVLIPNGEEAGYKSHVSASVGVYDKDVVNGFSLLPASSLGSLIVYALDSTDTYVWLYTETHEWGNSLSGKPAVPLKYLAAMPS